MREIKLRTWDGMRMTLTGIGFSNSLGLVTTPNNQPLMQFTGLQDRHGVDIYEGDVIFLNGFSPSNYEIKFIEGAFCACNGDIMPIDCHFFEDSTGIHSEVIGNIYENKELLNGKV